MLRSSLVLLLLVFSASAGAQGFDYNYLQLNYGNVEFDDTSIDGDGLGMSGSFAINPDWHVFGDYQTAGLDFGIDVSRFGAGIGYNTELSDVVDMFARFSYQYIELDIPGLPGDDDTGFGFGVGMRYAANADLELNAGIDYVDYGSGGDDTALSLGGLYSFTDAFALGFAGSWGDDISSYTLSGRFYFGE